MSNRNQRNAYYDSLPFPYQKNQVPYSSADGAPSIEKNRLKRNAYVDSLKYPYQRDQTKPVSNASGPRGIEEKREDRKAYYDALPLPYQRYQPYLVLPTMPFPYYGQQTEQILPSNGYNGLDVDNSAVIDEQPVIVPADLQSLSMLQQEGASGGETLAQQQQDFYSAEGPMDYVKSHTTLVGGLVIAGAAAFGIYWLKFRK